MVFICNIEKIVYKVQIIFTGHEDGLLLHLLPYLLGGTKPVSKKVLSRKTNITTDRIVQVVCSKQELREGLFMHVVVSI